MEIVVSLQSSPNSYEPLDFAVGKVAEGKAEWLYGEYFALMDPVMAEHGLEQVGSLAVLATNATEFTPQMGAINSWPDAHSQGQFLQGPRFVSAQNYAMTR